MKTNSSKCFKIITAIILSAVLITGTCLLAFASTTEEKTKESESKGFVLTDVSDVVDDVLPAVVSITSRTIVNNYNSYYGGYSDISDIFNYFFGGGYGNYYGNYGRSNNGDSRYYGYGEEEEEEPEEVDSGLGSGTIVGINDTELLILTSYHVVDDCSSLYVTFIDESDVDGYVKAAAEECDIAIVAVPLEDISNETLDSIAVAEISDEEPDLGDGVIVIGNALGYGMSVTDGIVSALHRTIEHNGYDISVIQTNAAINNGNSGGCMLNSKGQIIGISEAKIVVSYVEGMCYAISVYDNYDTIQELMTYDGTEEEEDNNAQGAYLGIQGRDVTSDIASEYGMPSGVYVAGTIAGGGAEAAGLREGDIICGVDDKEITLMSELQEILAKHNPGDVVSVHIYRSEWGGYSEKVLEVTLTDPIG